MFEAIHGSAPRRAGQNVANPSGLILAAVQMMVHIGQPKVAEKIHNGWLTTLEEGVHTYDIFKEGVSKKKVGTKEFAQAVIHNLGKLPEQLKAISYEKTEPEVAHKHASLPTSRHLVGADIYLCHKGILQDFLSKISHINVGPLRMQAIYNRGVKLWPQGQPETFCVDQWRCRFTSGDELRHVSQNDVIQLLHAFDHIGMDVIKAEFLYTFDGKGGFS